MPFKSQAQRRKFAQLLVEGKISGDTYEEWNRETGRKKLPERVTPTAAVKRVAKRAKPKAQEAEGGEEALVDDSLFLGLKGLGRVSRRTLETRSASRGRAAATRGCAGQTPHRP